MIARISLIMESSTSAAEDFLRLIRVQLAQDRGPDADCKPLYLSGARGSLFKVRLSSHGYTLVAKGVEHCDRRLLECENELYDRLRAIQGTHIPACLGNNRSGSPILLRLRRVRSLPISRFGWTAALALHHKG
jgi:hypothetical protein